MQQCTLPGFRLSFKLPIPARGGVEGGRGIYRKWVIFGWTPADHGHLRVLLTGAVPPREYSVYLLREESAGLGVYIDAVTGACMGASWSLWSRNLGSIAITRIAISSGSGSSLTAVGQGSRTTMTTEHSSEYQMILPTLPTCIFMTNLFSSCAR